MMDHNLSPITSAEPKVTTRKGKPDQSKLSRGKEIYIWAEDSEPTERKGWSRLGLNAVLDR